MTRPIYLDYNATTPIAAEAAEAMLPYLYETFGNPSSSHSYGVQSKLAVENARRQVAGLLEVKPKEIIFTSGGTEANNYAIRGYCLANRAKGGHIITSAVEHPAVLEVCHALETEGFELSILPVDEFGMVCVEDLGAVLRPDTLLVSVMHANNEVGTIQPVRALADLAHQVGAVFHCDAAQSLGKIAVNGNELGVDLLSMAGHKLYAPKGVGCLYVREGIRLQNLMYGAGHEGGHRPGTENVLEIVGLGKACEIARQDLTANQNHFRMMRDRLQTGLETVLGTEQVRMNGHAQERLPNTLSLSFREVEANRLLSEIGSDVAASAGAACHADAVTVSAVLAAMQVPLEWAMGTIRFSVGRGTTLEEVDRAVEIICAAVNKINGNK
ncbi:MAG: cysteine desulfurase NifS [Chloroflexi bacterium HGW-Chloroflexi-10]|nr:MAG: cysteine desulfurase NifS [Chloroflexi bacterium HGW-Chloroflexi-10]